MEISESTWAFIAKHRREDVRDVALHAKHDGDVDVPFALEQIAGWQRASLKLPDWASHDGLIFPPQVPMEQCSSQFTAQYKARLAQRLLAEEAVDDDSPASLVDLTGGFGVDFSYMSRVFNRATYVEQQSILCDIARHNFPILGLDHAEVINDDSTAVLDTLGRVSMIFLDPARRDDHGSRTYAIADCMPDVLTLKDMLLAKAPTVMVKLSPMLDWHKTVADFAGAVHEVHIVSTGNECKELLLVLGRGRCVSPLVVCANDEQVLSYKAGDNSDNHTTISDSALAARNTCNTEDSLSEESANDFDSSHWKYLYEPHAEAQVAMLIANQASDNDNKVTVEQVRRQLAEDYPLAAVPFDDYVEKSDVLEPAMHDQPVTVTPARIRRMESRSIHTANGIEVKIPTEMLSEDSAVEFLHDADGSVSLLIKNVIL